MRVSFFFRKCNTKTGKPNLMDEKFLQNFQKYEILPKLLTNKSFCYDKFLRKIPFSKNKKEYEFYLEKIKLSKMRIKYLKWEIKRSILFIFTPPVTKSFNYT